MNKSVCCVVLWSAVVLLARSATYYVATNGDDTYTGLNWANAVATISNGVTKAATAGDIVSVSNGTYVLTTNIIVTNGITLSGFNGRDVTIINANPAVSNRCVIINHSNAVVERFTLTGGNMPTNTFANGGYGGGAYVINGTLRDCIVISNISYVGGGVFNTNGVVTNCVISFNKTWGMFGGGGLAIVGGSASAYNCSIFGNSATSTVNNYGFGGGVYMVNALLAGCTVNDNISYSDGGGVLVRSVDGNNNVISNCLIANNGVGNGDHFGGGIMLRLCKTMTTIIDTTIRSNGGAVRVVLGGGICSYTSTSVIDNCTIDGNKAQVGGGICLYQGSSMLLTNCVISSNATGYYNSGNGGGINAGTYSGNSITAVWCRIVNNYANPYTETPGYGGGIYAWSNCALDHCVIQGNYFSTTQSGYSNWGAGVAIRSGGSGYIRNCLIADNVATGLSATLGGQGGGIYIGSNANFNVSACTFAGNYAKNSGGGVYLEPDGGDTFTNCVIASNRLAAAAADNDLYLPNTARSNAFYYSCGNALPNTQGNITNAPIFAGASTSNWRLADGSPGRDAGTVEAWMRGNTDLDGKRRFYSGFGLVDMGAYEHEKRGMVFSVTGY